MNVVRRRSLAAGITAVVLAVGVSWGAPPSADRVRILVRSLAGPVAAASAVEAVGGTVERHLPIIDGVAARVSADGVGRLATRHDLSIAPNETVTLSDHGEPSHQNDQNASVYTKEIWADALWAAGHDGDSVRVALIDTGVSPVPDLANRIAWVPAPTGNQGLVPCIDFSGEASCDDSYGHGTFIAGLIAGNGASSSGRYKGVAPGTQIVSIKIAGRDGSADVSKVLAAIQWVVSFADQLNIRVLNLSLGTNSRVSAAFDPLNFAVQRAWREGIVVVVSASNRGPQPGTISKPGDDPLVITVGAVDDRGTVDPRDDRLPDFSGRGPTVTDGLAKPDVVAPGGRVISLRSPGSFIEQRAPGGGIDDVYRRGSGTSMSAGIVSGAVALMLDAKPTWTPDRVKYALMSTAFRVASDDRMAVGRGLINVAAATWFAPEGLANQGVALLSDGLGALDGSRGDVFVTKPCAPGEHLLDPKCDRVHGERTAQGRRFDRRQYLEGDWSGSSWYESQWAEALLGSSWYGSSWYGPTWEGSSWYGSSWYGSSSPTFYGASVAGSSWYGAWD